MTGAPPLLLSAEEVAARGFRFGHPLEEEAEVTMTPLSRLTGLARAGVNLVRVAPGRKAFPLHRHMVEEEWTYVLSGEAEVTLGDAVHRLGAGAFVAFPAGGPPHQVRNAGDTELVCLMGGEHRAFEAVDFPDHGKRLTRTSAGTEIGAADSFEPFDFFSRTPLPVGTE